MIYIYIFNHISKAIGVYLFFFLQYKHRHNPWIDRFMLLIVYSVLFAVYQFHNINLNVLFMLVLFIPLFQFYNNDTWRKTVNNTLLVFALIYLSELFVESGFYFFRPDTKFEYDNSYELLFAAILIKIVYFIMMFILVYIRRRFADHFSTFHKSNIITISLIAFNLSLFALESLGFISSVNTSQVFWVYVVIISLLLLSVTIILITVHLQKEQTNLRKLQDTLQKKEIDESYTHIIKQLDHDQKILIHDYKNHLLEISALISDKAYDNVQKYIQELTHSDALSRGEVLTDNHALSVLFSRYREICKEKNISFSLDTKDSHLFYLSPSDTSSLFCNLMDNAIDACITADSPTITLRIGTDTLRNMDIISITNTCVTHPTFESNGFLATTKNDKLRHGFGMQSIQRVVDRYGGTLDTQYYKDDSLFQITISLYPEVNSDENSYM